MIAKSLGASIDGEEITIAGKVYPLDEKTGLELIDLYGKSVGDRLIYEPLQTGIRDDNVYARLQGNFVSAAMAQGLTKGQSAGLGTKLFKQVPKHQRDLLELAESYTLLLDKEKYQNTEAYEKIAGDLAARMGDYRQTGIEILNANEGVPLSAIQVRIFPDSPAGKVFGLTAQDDYLTMSAQDAVAAISASVDPNKMVADYLRNSRTVDPTKALEQQMKERSLKEKSMLQNIARADPDNLAKVRSELAMNGNSRPTDSLVLSLYLKRYGQGGPPLPGDGDDKPSPDGTTGGPGSLSADDEAGSFFKLRPAKSAK
jgi:hypothetical protein